MPIFPLASPQIFPHDLQMEATLRANLLALFNEFTQATNATHAWVGKEALRDNTAFRRLADPRPGFNIRTYDKLVTWFQNNWPEGVPWPVGVERAKDNGRHLPNDSAAR